jgi:transcriptional regulator with XRE-family HTH domain
MLYLAENLKALRKSKGITQEDAAEILGVSPQSVSKWERGDTYPDITLLPVLANLYETTIDALLGMERINDAEKRKAVFENGRTLLRNGDPQAAADVYREALKLRPNDESLLSELALTLALSGNADDLKQAADLCDRVLSGIPSEKVRHTTRAALCFIYYKCGEKERAVTTAQNLPHIRESRETILDFFKQKPDADSLDTYLRFIMLGNDDDRDVIRVFVGWEMIPLVEKLGLLDKIKQIRSEAGGEGKFPIVRLTDDVGLNPKQVRIKHYADYPLDKTFENLDDAMAEVVKALKGLVISSDS